MTVNSYSLFTPPTKTRQNCFVSSAVCSHRGRKVRCFL